jgi:hypothetical protein
MNLKRVTGLGLLVLVLTACMSDVGNRDTVGTADDAVVAVAAPESTESPPDIPGVPKWRAYIGAPKGHHARYGAASTRPDLVDELAYIVLVPPPDGRLEQRIPLFLRQAWRYGDVYFEELTKQMGLTPLDWLGIQMAIDDLEQHPRLLPPSSAYGTFEDGPGGPTPDPPPPLPGDDHGGPGSTTGGGQPGGGGTIPRPSPPPLPPDYTSPPPLPTVPPGMEQIAQNGIFPGDWPYVGWVPPSRPEDAGYTPQLGESKDLIRCEGHIYVAYKSNCIDFKPSTPGIKWTTKIINFFLRQDESFYAYVLHNLWNDGKNPQCMSTCEEVAGAGCYGLGAALLAVCAGLTEGACIAGIRGVAAGAGALGYGPDKCMRVIKERCKNNVCIK